MATLPRNPGTRAATVLRWTARGLSLLSFGFVLLIFVGDALTPNGGAPVPASEWLGIAFFPIGVLLGLALGWWRPTLGGAVSVGCLALFYLWMLADRGFFPGGPWFALVALPGAFFLALGVLERRIGTRR